MTNALATLEHEHEHDDDTRWEAVVRRDATADGTFVYAVLTTGVYCRPSCPSRLARRENVSFHRTPALAEQAGYRACKRCDPRGGGTAGRHAAMVARACRLLETADAPPSLADLAAHAGTTPFYFHRVFKQVTGLTPKAWVRARRAERTRDALAAGGSVTRAMHDAGWQTSSRFYAEAPKVVGMPPSAFRAGGGGATITYAVAPCSLGHVLVAATDKGICAIQLADDPEALTAWLRARFPKASLEPGGRAFGRHVRAVVDLVERPASAEPLSLPLDLAGTAFQRRVWAALATIPPGTTSTYAEIARAIGAPKAVRAVGAACGANEVAIAIPCHRAVRSDGGLAGYRWGTDRKRALLERERDR